MPSKSKSQQRFMGMVRAAQKGEKPASPEVAKAAKTMKKKDVEDFASTKHDNLPEKKRKTEGFANSNLSSKKLKEFEKGRHKNAEVLGYKLAGVPDVKTEIGKLREFLKKTIKENVKLPIKVGDTVKMGKFKNKSVKVKTIGWNDKGDLLINGRPALKFRLVKEGIIKEGKHFHNKKFQTQAKDGYNKWEIVGEYDEDDRPKVRIHKHYIYKPKKGYQNIRKNTSHFVYLTFSNEKDAHGTPYWNNYNVKSVVSNYTSKPKVEKTFDVIKNKYNSQAQATSKGKLVKTKGTLVNKGWGHKVEDHKPGHDKEGKMAKYDAKEIFQDAKDVFKMIDEYSDLPEWLEAKITKAGDYMNTVKDYLTHHHSGTNEEKITESVWSLPKGATTTSVDELDAELSRAGIKSNPDFTKLLVQVSGNKSKINKIMKTHKAKKIFEGLDLKKLETAIKDFQKKIKKQGRVTNARDENHLEQLIKVYKQMGGKKIKEGKWAGTETSQAAPPKSSKEKQAVKLYGAYIEYKMNSGNSEYGYADQRNQLALKMLKDKFKVPSNLKSKLKDKKYHDKFTDYKSIVWEGKLTEMNEPWFEITYKDSRGRKKTDSMRAKNPKEAKKDFVNLMKGRGFKVLKVVKEGKLTEKKMDRRKAAEILKQIGGNRFIAMTGAKGFAFSDKYMSFKIGRNSKGINFVRIGHNAKDLYDMEFGFVSTRGIKVKKKVKDVYADMLGTIFTKYTGMHVRL